MVTLLIYGANGYTGELIARRAVAEGLRPILAGRSSKAVGVLAKELELEHRVFGLDDSAALDAGLRGVHAALHCAGPFARTYRPMVDACVRNGAHYLDITGEVAVLEGLAARDAEARSARIMVLPGVGFDVVPSDCLAAHLKGRLPSATHLTLGFQALNTPSRGTAMTIVEGIHRGGLVRRNGVLTRVPAAWKTRVIDFGAGPTKAFTIPWGDVSTAYHSTGIPNVEVYIADSRGQLQAARISRYFGWALGSSLVQGLLKQRIRSGPAGPGAAERAQGRSYLWGEAADGNGRTVVARLQGPEGYTLTALTAVAVLKRVLAGDAPAGFQTPSKAYGSDFILGIEGVSRVDDR